MVIKNVYFSIGKKYPVYFALVIGPFNSINYREGKAVQIIIDIYHC